MKPGPRPKPTMLKKVQGIRSHKKINDKEPIIKSKAIKPPKWMNKEEILIWNEYIQQCPDGLITGVDGPLFSRWVVEYLLYQRAHAIVVESESLTISAQSGYESPIAALIILRKASDAMLKIENEIGFTPASRSRIQIEAPREEDEFTAFLKSQKKAAEV